LREQEALILREKIDTVLKSNPNANLVVLGDFNDTHDTKSTRALIGRGKTSLIDTRPAERNGDHAVRPRSGSAPRTITWTFPRPWERKTAALPAEFAATRPTSR